MKITWARIALYAAIGAVAGFVMAPHHVRAEENGDIHMMNAGTAIAANILCGKLFTAPDIQSEERLYSKVSGVSNMTFVHQVAANIASKIVVQRMQEGMVKPFCKAMRDLVHGTVT